MRRSTVLLALLVVSLIALAIPSTTPAAADMDMVVVNGPPGHCFPGQDTIMDEDGSNGWEIVAPPGHVFTDAKVKAATDCYSDGVLYHIIGIGTPVITVVRLCDAGSVSICPEISHLEGIYELKYELCDEMTDWVLVISSDWTWDPDEQDFFRVHIYEKYDLYDQTHMCDTKDEIEWQGYELCNEMTDWVLMNSTDWTWDPDEQDFFKVHTYEKYDLYDQTHVCDTKEEIEWREYETCDEMTDWVLVHSTDWTWDPDEQDFFRVHTYEKYDLLYNYPHVCDTKEEI